jgi:Acetoacetate decarboxylase (ADC)
MSTGPGNALLPVVRRLMSFAPSAVPRRQRRLAGRRAVVDGIPFTLPVNSEQTPALMAAFPVDGDAAARLLPGDELHPVRLPGGKGLLVVTVVNYEITDIGRYVEYSLAIACTFGAKPAPPLLPGLLRGHYGTGQFVLDLPVSSEISVKGGKGIWGMPKHQANLDFTITPTTVSSQYDVDGLLGARIEIDRPPETALPLDVGAANYCVFRGMVMKSFIYFQGAADIALGKRAKARLYLGDAPQVAPLHGLGIEPDAVFTAFLPSTRGVLDDHFECWFMTSGDGQHETGEGLDSVVTLGRSEEWLDPPKVRVGSAR